MIESTLSVPRTGHGGRITVRPIDEQAHWQFLQSSPYASFQQTPEWGRARSGIWDTEDLGWFDEEGKCVGVAVVRYRSLPKTPWRFAYLPDGPVIDWERQDLGEILRALEEHMRAARVFAVRIIPRVAMCTWYSGTVKAAIADENLTSLREVVPDHVSPIARRTVALLQEDGWSLLPHVGQLAAHQALHTVCLPLEGRTQDEIRAGMNSTWRRNIRAAERHGVDVVEATRADLPAVKRMADETAARLGFESYPLEYFETMWDVYAGGDPARFRVHIARHEGTELAAIGTSLTGGRAQAVFIANSSEKRELRASNAVYDVAIRTAHADGASVYDFGGVDASLEADDPGVGLLRFKSDLGGETRECIGAWELTLNAPLHRAFSVLLPVYTSLRNRLPAARTVEVSR